LIACPLWHLRALLVAAAISVSLLGGCATNGNPRDPFEPVNRAVYQFNDGFDKLIAKPAAEFYEAVVPGVIRTGVGNFFSNLNDVIVALNNLLQGKVPEAINDAGRVLVNTTLGVFGVMDPATALGVEKHNEDFGQTLGYWGLGSGPYIVLPFLGPSSARDTVGWVGDVYAWPGTYLEPSRDRNILIGARFIAARADLLRASSLLETAALDPYEFLRDAYLQRRNNLVHDGNPPEDVEPADAPAPKPSGGKASPSGSTATQAAPAPAENGSNWRSSFDGVEKPRPEAAKPAIVPAVAPATPRRIVRLWLPASRD
jgi:phospholipid-binding lipoprotein MlaA